MKKFLLKKLVPLLGVLFLIACAGSANGPLADGGPSAANHAEGTLGSQPDLHTMSDICEMPYILKFSGEKAGALEEWYILQPEQKNFPSPGLILKAPKDPIADDQICDQCGGRVVRVIDYGEVPILALTSAQYESEYAKFWLGLRTRQIDPAVLAEARYQDFVVTAVGNVTLKGLPIAINHNYQFLLSNKVMEPVTTPTAFNSAEELYGMLVCPDKPNDQLFSILRNLRPLDHVPGNLLNVHIPDDSTVSVPSGKFFQQSATVIQPVNDEEP